jgi:sucrose-6-phosphate hydrolase SacC (GH32 family)
MLCGAGFVRFITPWHLRAESWTAERTEWNKAQMKFRVGRFLKIYDPSKGEKQEWYINDHTFIRAADGQWHLFGITHTEPANPLQEKFLAHATAPELKGPWTRQPSILRFAPELGETLVWAPYVFRHEGAYWMFYCAGGAAHEKYRIHLATSPDLFHWDRHPGNPMIVDGYDARDPMVMRYQGKWILYYTATSDPTGGHHTVMATTSSDLIHWAQKKTVFVATAVGKEGGPTESPFVVTHNGKYFLFVCTNRGYNDTAVYESDDPFYWDAKNRIGSFRAHAAEVIQTPEKWFVSRAGWGQGGVWLAEFTWKD